MELFKTIAAFGGLALGLVNLGLLIYKDYLRRGKLRAVIRRAEVRAVVCGTFDIHLDLDLNAVGGSIYLKELELTHSSSPVFDPMRDVRGRNVLKLIGYPGYSTLDLPLENFEETVKSLFASSHSVTNLKLDDKEHRILSVVDRICTERAMDGFWDWPRSGWHLRVVHSEGETVIPLSFKVHSSNQVSAFAGA